MSIVKYTNNKTSERKYLGRLDPETNEIIKAKPRVSKADEDKANKVAELRKKINSLKREIKEKDYKIKLLENQIDSMISDLKGLASECSKYVK